MSATQVQIAEKVGIDISSVNKILNRRKDSVFKKETRDLVFKVAEELGYDFGRASKGTVLRAFAELYEAVVNKRPISGSKLAKYRKLIERAGGAAIVLLVLRCIVS